MPARVITNSQKGSGKNSGAQKAQLKASVVKEIAQTNEEVQQLRDMDPRAQFYTGNERLNIQGSQVQRIRELQEENDHLQREISSKENEVVSCSDPLAILADIEHRKIIISRNTGEVLKIYQRNEERLKRIKELEAHNSRIQNELMSMQGKFISTNDMEERTDCASRFFLLKSTIENNLAEIEELSKH